MVIKYWLVLFASFALSQAFAQEEGQEEAQTPQEEVSTPSSGRVEKLEVTGSHIKRIDVEGPSPVLTLDRDYLDRTGFNNVGDVLRETTVASFGGDRETALSGGAETGASTTSLRGFGSERILILLNGQRLPTIGGSSSVDLALIPMAAVERIEILKDGASATYGSDALGGVINLITKKDYDGSSIELGYANPESQGGNRTDVKASYGKTFSKGSVLAVAQYRSNKETWSRDYDYAVPTPGWYSSMGSPGTWLNPILPTPPADKPQKQGVVAADCPANLIRPIDPNDTTAGNYCAFDYSPYSQITPGIEQYSALLTGDYEVTSDIKVFATGVYTRREVSNQLAPAPDRFRDDSPGPNTQVPQATATGWGLPGVNGPIDVQYRLVEEGGPRIGQVNSDSFNINTGVRGYLGDTWDWEFSLTHGESKTENRGISGYANKGTLLAMANESPTAFNPFLPSGSKSDITRARYQPVDGINSSMSTVNLKATGELMNLPAGPLAMAVGVSNAYQTFEQTTDSVTGAGLQWGGGVSAVGKGRRDFQSAYTEFSLPPMENMEIQLSGRFDNYSDFGSTVNPKVGFRYKPINEILFRGTWGTGFRAPDLANLYRGSLKTFPFGSDPISGQDAQFESQIDSNRNLKEETTQSINFGTVWQATDKTSITLDYWKTKQNNSVTVATNRQIFQAEQAFGNSYLNNFGIDVQRDCPTCVVKRIINPAINLSSVDVSGLDVALEYSTPLKNGYRFRFAMNHSVLFEYITQVFPGMPLEDRAGFAGIPRWRNVLDVTLSQQNFDYGFVIRTIGEQNFSELAQQPGLFGKTRDHSEIDLKSVYRTSWDGTFSFIIRNVTNRSRPVQAEYLSSGFLNTNIYDPFGRTFIFNYRQDF